MGRGQDLDDIPDFRKEHFLVVLKQHRPSDGQYSKQSIFRYLKEWKMTCGWGYFWLPKSGLNVRPLVNEKSGGQVAWGCAVLEHWGLEPRFSFLLPILPPSAQPCLWSLDLSPCGQQMAGVAISTSSLRDCIQRGVFSLQVSFLRKENFSQKISQPSSQGTPDLNWIIWPHSSGDKARRIFNL